MYIIRHPLLNHHFLQNIDFIFYYFPKSVKVKETDDRVSVITEFCLYPQSNLDVLIFLIIYSSIYLFVYLL